MAATEKRFNVLTINVRVTAPRSWGDAKGHRMHLETYYKVKDAIRDLEAELQKLDPEIRIQS